MELRSRGTWLLILDLCVAGSGACWTRSYNLGLRVCTFLLKVLEREPRIWGPGTLPLSCIPGSPCIAQVGLDLMICLLQPVRCWHLTHSVLGFLCLPVYFLCMSAPLIHLTLTFLKSPVSLWSSRSQTAHTHGINNSLVMMDRCEKAVSSRIQWS